MSQVQTSNSIKDFRIIIFLLVTCLGHSLFGQDNAKAAFPEVVPPAPDAAALGKYGEIPVGTYTGIPEVNIPLYTVQSRKLSLPISLSYHAGGVKVEDVASNVGLGWSLNAGGVITRSVQGLPDESPNGFFNNTLPADMANLTNADLKLIAENKRDAVPDDFYFNFGSYAGKLVFRKDGTCFSIPHFKIKIKPAIGPQNGGTTYWEITAEDGTKYTFSSPETSTTQSACATGGGVSSQSYDQLMYISSWYLTSIQAPQTAEQITFSYLPYTIQMDAKGSTSHYLTSDDVNEPNYTNYCGTTISVSGKFINRIDFPGGKIDFVSSSRADLSGAVRLTSMTVSNYLDEPVTKYLFDNDQYFESGCSTALCKRLKLDGITRVGKNNVQQPPHLFEYNTEALPPRNSNDTDHWGYYNKRGNTLAYPEFIDYFNERPDFDYLPGANKKPDINAVKAGTLTKIIYPTGGYTTFDYELNEVVSNALPNKTSAKTKKRIDGTSSNPNQQSTNFTIQGYFQNGLYVKVRYQTTGCSTSTIPSLEANCPNVQIVGVNGTNYTGVFQSGLLKEVVIFLPNGQYKLTGANAGGGQSYFLEVEYEPELNTVNKFAGGLRVQRVTDSDGMDATKNVIRKYVYNDGAGASTGRISNYPLYHYNYTYITTTGICLSHIISCFVRTSGSNTSLGTTRSSYVGYGKVTELRGELGENGKSEYFYTSVWKSEQDNNTAFKDSYVYTLPFGPPQTDNEWLRGYLINKIDYKYQASTYLKVNEVINQYQTLGTGIEIRGVKASISKTDDPCISGDQTEYLSTLIRRYGALSYIPQYTIERVYNPDGVTFAESRKDFVYGVSHRQLSQVTNTLDSYANSYWTQTTKYKYPEDYTISAATDAMSIALNTMKTTAFIHNSVIEKQVWEQRNGISKLIDAELNLYKPNGYELDKQLKLVAAIPLTSYTAAYVNGSGNFIYQTTDFNTQITYDVFDTPTGNLIEATGIDGVKKSFLWGNQKLYPIAEAVNAANTMLAYTSFEENYVGNWTIPAGVPLLGGDGASGSRHYIGQLETTSLMPAGKYFVSFWAKGTGNVSVNGVNVLVNNPGWAPFATEITLNASTKISMNSNGLKIDELRVHPVNSQMRTFTYSPAVGMTSSTSVSNLPINYIYDDYNRLKHVVDHQGNILKQNLYNLKGYAGPAMSTSLNAAFSFNGTQSMGGPITFTAVNSDAGIIYDWDYGDGATTSNGTRVINHTYTAAGIYLATLTVRTGTLQNSSQKYVQIVIPTLPDPIIAINTITSGFTFPNQTLTINATAAASGGVTPYQSYTWQVFDQNGAIVLPGQWTTTTSTANLTFTKPTLTPQNCVPTQVSYVVKCRVVDSGNNTSNLATTTATYTEARTLIVSASSIQAEYNEAPQTITVTGSDSNITVTSNVGWLTISNISQCSSFILNFAQFNGPATSRNGSVTVTSSNGTQTINVTQYKQGL